ncbi:MAG: AMP-binding protein [Pseudomonadota bacterium]
MNIHEQPYTALYDGFRWAIPDDYNIAVHACDDWAEREPDRLALRFVFQGGAETRDWTYGALRALTNQVANVLRARGVGMGDRVAVLLPQSVEVAATHLAAHKLGAVSMPLAAVFGPEALQYRLADSGTVVLVTDQVGAAKLATIRDQLPDLKTVLTVDGAIEGTLAFWDQVARASDQLAPVSTTPDMPALMIYTSGTTGPPKGALHGHRVLPGHIPGVQFPHEFLPQPGDRLWTPADWAWAGGLLNVLLPGLALGVPVVGAATEKFDPEAALAFMAREGIRNAFIPPTALRMLMAVPAASIPDTLSLRTVGSGGESLGKAAYHWAREALGLTINEFYGQTECNLVLSSCSRIDVSRPGAIGKAVPGHTVGIVNAEGEELPPGSPGEIAIKAPDPVMFLSYWNRPDAMAEKFAGNWMLTGDQGVMDEDGYVSFVGRTDDIITSAGYRIGPGEIEDCLVGHPAIKLAAAVGVPDPVRTEIVKAFVVLKPGELPSDELKSSIRDHVRSRLSAHEYPREIDFRDSLPLTSTGKVIRRALRHQ